MNAIIDHSPRPAAATEFKQTRRGYVDALVELAREMTELVVLDSDVAKASKTCDFEQTIVSRYSARPRSRVDIAFIAAGVSSCFAPNVEAWATG